MLTVIYQRYKNAIVMAVIGIILFSAVLWAMANNVSGSDNSIEIDRDKNDDMRAESRAAIKNMTFYLQQTQKANYVFDYSTTTIFNTMVGNNLTNLSSGGGKVKIDWYLHPVLAGDFHINGDIFILMNVQMRSDSNNFNGALNVNLWDVSNIDSGGTRTESSFKTGTSGNIDFTTSVAGYGITLTGVDYTVPANHGIRVEFEITGGASNYYFMLFGDNVYDSHIVFQSESYIQAGEVYTENYKGELTTNFQLDETNKNMDIIANITDPFGGYDIKMVNMTLTSPTGAIILDNVGMTKFEGTNISFSSKFSVAWNYDGAQVGRYNITVWAVDWNGYNYYYYRLNYNFGVYPDTNIGYFLIGGLPNYGDVKVFDSLGQPLEGAVVKAQLGGNTWAVNTTNSTGIAGLDGYPGIYNIIVEWQDVVVETRTNFDFIPDFYLELTCDVFYPEFKVVDNSNSPLKGANIYIGHPNGTFSIIPLITDDNGLFKLEKAPIGNFQVIVKWRDVEVANIIELVDNNGLLDTIVCEVFKVQLTLVDSKGIGLPKAQIIMANSLSRLILDSQISSLSGAIISQLPVGDYNISVYWLQRIVKEFDLTLNNDYTETIVCDVFYVNFLVLDTHQQPVENAAILITDKDTDAVLDSSSTDLNGIMESRLPIGVSDVKVYWNNILVHSSSISITSDVSSANAIPLNCEIYYLTINCLDYHGVPLDNAQVQIFLADDLELLDFAEADSNGTVIFRLPVNSYDFMIYWLNTKVYNRFDFNLNSDHTLDILCTVYYINITPVDSRDQFLEAARIDIYDISTGQVTRTNIAGSDGKALFRLPANNHIVKITWLDVNVSYSIQEFSMDDDVIIKCQVFYMTIYVVDFGNFPVENANVFVNYNKLTNIFDSGITNLTGKVISRLPIGNYSIAVTWKDVEVYQVINASLTADRTQLCPARIYYIDVKAVDKDNANLGDVLVTIQNLDTNTGLTESGYTNDKGDFQFRLPYGTYEVRGRLITTYLLAEIDMKTTEQIILTDSSERVKLEFKEYPPPVYVTPAFAAASFAIIVIILFLLLWLFVIRKLKKKLDEGKKEGVTELPMAKEAPPAEPAELEGEKPAAPPLAEPVKETLPEDDDKPELPPGESVQSKLPEDEDE
jgi:hypothetical protein